MNNQYSRSDKPDQNNVRTKTFEIKLLAVIASDEGAKHFFGILGLADGIASSDKSGLAMTGKF